MRYHKKSDFYFFYQCALVRESVAFSGIFTKSVERKLFNFNVHLPALRSYEVNIGSAVSDFYIHEEGYYLRVMF